MKTYKVKIEFVTDYLQARFTENAQKELENFISKGICKSEEDSWKVFLYADDKNGIYLPNIHIRHALVNSGKEFKVKKQRRSMKQWVTSNILVEPQEIFFGKKDPDKVIESYPKRKDGSRVKVKHPAMLAGTKVDFLIKSLDDTMEDKAIKDLVEMAGKMYGIGGRRADMFGRFEVVEFKKQ